MSTTQLEENKRIARRVPEEIATQRKLDLIEEVAAADAVDHGPITDVHGHAEIRAHMERYFDAFEDFSATVEDMVAEGDMVAMRVTLRGKHTGEFMGIEPTGKEFEIPNMVFSRIEDGKIVERWTQPDMLGLMAQLGVVDVPEMSG